MDFCLQNDVKSNTNTICSQSKMTDIRFRLEKKARADFENAMAAFHVEHPMPDELKIAYHSNIMYAPERNTINQFEEYKRAVISYEKIVSENKNMVFGIQKRYNSIELRKSELITIRAVSSNFPMLAAYDTSMLNNRVINIIRTLCGRYKQHMTEMNTQVEKQEADKIASIKKREAESLQTKMQAEQKARAAAIAEERLIAQEAERRFKEIEREAKIQAKVDQMKYAAELASLFN
jgi:hypothetical protein